MASLNNIVQDPFFKRFFRNLLIFTVLVSAAIGGAWYGFQELSKDLAAKAKPKEAKLNQLKSEVDFLVRQVELYQQYGDKYAELMKKGLVKQQDRVFWADNLIRLKQGYLMPKFSFEFLPEKPLSSAQFQKIKVPQQMFYFSRIKLNMELQHEEDLLRLFESINERISPLYLIESCDNKLRENNYQVSANFNLTQGNVIASCTVVVFHTHINLGQKPDEKVVTSKP
ncbi:hypothetical protein THMIRHAS_19780 [Thiosulfatimonas sediminis]|uniref:Uncharacterized protein n=1 Tax=Thiosulfatimonas sediminis TaxID=2675054 RepID=A0A6F8PWV5_9GAMM|nr:hypothetical protein [Thiosulfatimonas sediminis]BBP46605.1 hypothetical protein THMIRHAS_19780 [Thiosulfatimonas sediminis]